jgi:hypothetical protein
VLFADHPQTRGKHSSFEERRFLVDGKLLAANVRRLPEWSLSLAFHDQHYGKWPDYAPGPTPTPAEIVEAGHADQCLARVVGDHEVDRWIRMEHLEDDLVAFLNQVDRLTPEEEQVIRSVGRVNTKPFPVPAPGEFFTPGEVDALYRRNPRWAEVERRTYGR